MSESPDKRKRGVWVAWKPLGMLLLLVLSTSLSVSGGEPKARFDVVAKLTTETSGLADIKYVADRRQVLGLEYHVEGNLVECSLDRPNACSVLARDLDFARSLDFTGEKKAVAVANDSGLIRIFNATTGELRQQIYPRMDAVYSVAFSPDGSRLAATGRFGLIWVGEYVEGQGEDNGAWVRQKLLDAHRGNCQAVALGSNDALVSGGSDGKVRLWNLKADTDAICILEGGKGCFVTAVEIAETSGKVLIGGGRSRRGEDESDPLLLIWDVNTGQTTKLQNEHSEWIVDLAVNATLGMAVSASADGKVCVWDIKTGTALGRTRLEGGITAMACSESPFQCVAASGKEIVVWSITVTSD